MQHGVKKVSLSQEAKRLKREKDKQKIAVYQLLVEVLLSSKHSNKYSEATLKLTGEVLALNPELYVAWNYRREILLALIPSQLDRKSTLEEELKMVMFYLKRYPKCYWVWNHRIWCLLQLNEHLLADWDYELAIVLKLLEADSRNFHGWQYRRWVVLMKEKAFVDSPSTLLDSVASEFAYTTMQINKNILNFSAWHQRLKLIPRLAELIIDEPSSKHMAQLSQFSSPKAILAHELELIKTGMYVDADDSSVWLYLEWLLTDPFFREADDEEMFRELLLDQLKIVDELNELEIDDDPQNRENIWCLKGMIFLHQRLREEAKKLVSKEEIELVERLIKRDPLREGRYKEQLALLRG